MATTKQVLRIVVASPSDVQPERDVVQEVVEELNRIIANEKGLVLEISRWETDAYPGFHPEGPQGLIDSLLHIEDCDLLIGIFWKRFGTPVLDAQSGTEHEFRTAYEAWKRNGRPQIMIYFNQKSYTPKTKAEVEQWGQVLDFKDKFPKEGLWWPYNGKAKFEKLIRNHLAQFILNQVPAKKVPANETTPAPTLSRTIIMRPPLTDASTIQQREQSVQDIYAKLIQPDITALVLTGIGGLGKSTLAALDYHYAENQRKAGNGPFKAEALWFRIDEAVTMTDLGAALLEALGKPSPDFGHLDSQSQAIALFNELNTTDKSRLIVFDQFENLLDWQTGKALPNRPGVSEWLDLLNSEKCKCRVLLTSRPRPQGTRPAPMTHLKEYPVQGMSIAEGIDLLRKQGVTQEQGTDAELRAAIQRCSGHALSLTLLATLLYDNNLSLSILFNDSTYEQFWTGDIASNLLDYIYKKQLNEAQRKLLLAFSVYREPVPLSATEALIDFNAEFPKSQMQPTLRALLAQHLLQASGEGRYQLHAIVVDYAKGRFVEGDEQANHRAIIAAHEKAAKYYQRAARNCPPREKRRRISDVRDLIEAIWQYCQAEQWQLAYNLMVREGIFFDLNRWGGNAVLLEMCELLLPPEKWHPERLNAGIIYHSLGKVYGNLGKKAKALECFKEALNIYTEVGKRKRQGIIKHDIALAYDDLGNRTEALTYYKQALEIHREVGNRREEGVTLIGLGRLYHALGKKEEALTYYKQALEIHREVSDLPREGVTLNNLGRIYADLGEKAEALSYYKQALSIFEEVGDPGGKGSTLHNIGIIYFEQDRYDIALACFLLARPIFEEIQSPVRDKTQGRVNQLCRVVGEERFAALSEQVEPRANQIVEQALREGL